MNRIDGSTTSDLYLVRLWKQKSPDGTFSFRGKLQHAVSGAACRFNGLGELPWALQRMMEEEAGLPGTEGTYVETTKIQIRPDSQGESNIDAR